MEEQQQQPENGVDRILTPILDQLAALQRQVAGMTSERLPTPPDAKERDLPDASWRGRRTETSTGSANPSRF